MLLIKCGVMTKLEQTSKVILMAEEISQKYYKKPLVVTYSGGKDSDVLLDIVKKTLKPSQFEVINSHTTVDAPPTVYHIREVFKNLEKDGIKTSIIYPPKTMWQLIVDNGMPPTRLARYCCSVLKEQTVPNRVILTGVRADESTARKGREFFPLRGKTKADAKYFNLEHTESVFADAEKVTEQLKADTNTVNAYDCTLVKNAKENNDIIAHPIYEWTTNEIWQYVADNGIKLCDLYSMGYDRVGCIGCPEGSYCQKKKQFADFPEYEINYKKAFQRMIDKRKAKGLPVKDAWKDGTEVFNWWIEEYKHIVKGQMTFDDFLQEMRNNGNI